MRLDEAQARLVALAREHGGTVTAAHVEADDVLSGDRALVSAAARSLAGSTNVFTYDDQDDGRQWFPYGGIIFELKAGQISS
jgi:hypothetical protein